MDVLIHLRIIFVYFPAFVFGVNEPSALSIKNFSATIVPKRQTIESSHVLMHRSKIQYRRILPITDI